MVTSDPGELAACAACGHWWIAEAPAASPEPEPPEPAVEVEPLLPPRERGPIAALPRPVPTPESHPWEFELQLGVGDQVQGPHDRMFLREGLYVGRLTGDERIRVPGASAWERLGDRPEFAEVLQLLEKDGAAPRGNTRIAGWQRSGVPEPTVAPAPAPAPAPVAAAAAAAAEALPDASRLPMLVGIAVGIAVVLAGVGYALFG